MDKKSLASLVIRYAILVILGLFNLALFYIIFTPLTLYPVFFLISRFFEDAVLVSLSPVPAILFKGYIARIIQACVAGSAYYLLLILNLTTPMALKKRIESISFLLLSFLIINIIRITVFALMVPAGYQYFDATHELTWYFGSTIMIVFIWFLNVFLFKIDSTPVYSDIKSLYQDVRGQK